jgi:hypothetical protein
MAQKSDVDRLIREAFKAQGVEGIDLSPEPGLSDMVTEIFRGRLWWVGACMIANIVACTILAVICGVQLFRTDIIQEMIRWGAGFFFSINVVIGCKLWYWMRVERLTMVREIKRVELLVAQLAVEQGRAAGTARVPPAPCE